jgi:hypothetical protein
MLGLWILHTRTGRYFYRYSCRVATGSNGVWRGQAFARILFSGSAAADTAIARRLGIFVTGNRRKSKIRELGRRGDVALLKRMRNSEQWLRLLCVALLRESGILVPGGTVGAVRIVDGTIVKESGKTGSQWRILHCIQLPSLTGDSLEITASDGEGNGESLNRLPVAPHDLVLADAGYCSVAGIEYIQKRRADVLVRVKFSSLRRVLAGGRTLSSRLAITAVIPNGTGGRVAGHFERPDIIVWRPGLL